MARRVKAAQQVAQLPQQPCGKCGSLLSATELSTRRFQDSISGHMDRGYFYKCICSPEDLQPMSQETYELLRQSP